MRKIAINLVALFLLSVFAVGSAAAAGLGFGAAGHRIQVEANGAETASAGTTGEEFVTVDSTETIASYYLELTMGENNGWAIGYEIIPGSADVSDATHTRTDTETSVTGTETAVSNSRKFTADAEVEDFKVIYAEVPVGSLLYVRAGLSEITVNTKETASGNGGNYGNATLDGMQYGIGMKGLMGENFRWKVGYEINDFDQLKLTSSGNSVSGETNTLKANLDTSALKVGIGIQF